MMGLAMISRNLLHGLMCCAILIPAVIVFNGCRREPPLPPSYAQQFLDEWDTQEQSPPSALVGWAYPTDQTNLLAEGMDGVFQPTASGRSISALYGSVRTLSGPKGLYASFHEGVDIAACSRDRQGRPLDEIRAIAPGIVAYANKRPGNSNYGNYVVLLHDDPFGQFYTLYAHMISVASNIVPGRAIKRGETLGKMGNTPNIPWVRAHLHLEIGVMLNSRFDVWFRSQKMTPDHGKCHGLNLAGMDPLEILAMAKNSGDFSLGKYMLELPAAFALLFRAANQLEFFQRHPSLWIGPMPSENDVVRIAISEGGVPLRGRIATYQEIAALGKARALVTDVNPDVLGRNGRRLILRRSGEWALSRSGESVLAILKH